MQSLVSCLDHSCCRQLMLDAHKTIYTPACGATLAQTLDLHPCMWCHIGTNPSCCCRWVPGAFQQVEAAGILPRPPHFPYMLLPAQHAPVLISAGVDSWFHQNNTGVKGLWVWLDIGCGTCVFELAKVVWSGNKSSSGRWREKHVTAF